MLKKTTLILLVVILLVGCKRSKFGSEKGSFRHDGEKRTYLVHVPDSYDGNSAVSLVVGLHGGVGSARQFEEQSQLANYSDNAGFILVCPNGIKRTWNGGGCCGKARENDIDDVGFIARLIDKMIEDYNIDPKRVYVTGLSNGGFMAYRLACELPDKIAAIAPVGATMNVTSCNPCQSQVAIIHFHSYNDESIPHTGGVGDGLSDHYNPPLDSVFNVWATNNGCDDPGGLIYDGSDYDLKQWNTCSNYATIAYYITHDGGHSWPGGEKPFKKADDPSESINANSLMWSFFQEHPKP